MQLILDAVVDYLPSPTEVDPQPLTDEERRANWRSLLLFLLMKHLKRLRSKSWMTVLVPLLSSVSTQVR